MRKIILDAAMELFIQEGYNGVSIRKIADKIEYSPGSIYTYFQDKDSIFYELHVEGFGILYQKQLSVQAVKTIPVKDYWLMVMLISIPLWEIKNIMI